MAPLVGIRHFTDPACPFAFSAERQRLRLDWLYGDQLRWETHMVVLRSETGDDFSAEKLSAGLRKLQLEYGMPIDWRERVRPGAATIHACRAVVATRLRWPDRSDALLRRLRVLVMAGEPIDDSDTLELAAAQAGLPVDELAAYCAEPEVEEALRADMAAARNPSPAARAQDYKLGGPAGARRYTCPSYELSRLTEPPADWDTARRVDLPGFRPVEAYEAALANLAPELARRPDPSSVEEVLSWAGMPLATAEVAAVADRGVADVRAELARSGARFAPVGGDGYWALPGASG
jgi:predicted DsbA family dithiol-disulfide isomerase